jgi:peptide/nickel transport system permease protein
MIRLILSRLFIAIPLLLAVSFTAFILKDILQSDEAGINREDQGRAAGPGYNESGRLLKDEDYKLPLFYFSIRPLAYPDTLSSIIIKAQKLRIKRFIHRGVNWKELKLYLAQEDILLKQLQSGGITGLDNIGLSNSPEELRQQLEYLPDSVLATPEARELENRIHEMVKSTNIFPMLLPTFHWHGFSNRYHQWLKKIIKGDWGISRVDYRPSWIKIKEAIAWTLSINLISLILVFGLAILLGEWLFLHHLKKRGKAVETILFFLYSIPRFFLAMLFIQFFASDTIHPSLHILPSPGFFDADPSGSIINQWFRYATQLILPVISIVLPSMAYLTRIYANRLLDEKSKPYAFMAWSKGDSPGLITRKHLRRNALMPLVALLGLEIPALIGGSVVIEVLFNLPGMGRLMLQSIVMQDWVIVFSILLLTAVFTIVGKLIADILYSLLDPRVTWSKS